MDRDGPSFDLPGVRSWMDLLHPAGWTFLIRVLGAGLGYGMHVLIGRWLGAEVYGGYILAMGWAVLLSRVEALGLPSAVLRLVPEYDTEDKYGLFRGLLRGSRGMVIGAGVVLSLGTTGVLLLVPLFSEVQRPAILTGIWIAPVLALVGLETEILRSQRRMVWAYAPPRVLRPCLLIGGVLVVAASPLPDSAPTIVGLLGAILVGTFLVQYTGTRRIIPNDVRTAEPSYAPQVWLGIAGPLFLMKGFIVAITKTDIFVIGALLDNSRVGIYGAALQTAHTIMFVGVALDSIASSAVNRLHTQGDREGLQELVVRLAQYYFWPTLALAVIIAAAAPRILGLFGTEFTGGRPILIVLMGGLLANASTGCQKYLLMLTGHHRTCAWIYGCSLVLNVILNTLGVLTFGIVGAAFATAATMAFWNVWMYVVTVRRLGVDPTVFAAFRPSPPSR